MQTAELSGLNLTKKIPVIELEQIMSEIYSLVIIWIQAKKKNQYLY